MKFSIVINGVVDPVGAGEDGMALTATDLKTNLSRIIERAQAEGLITGDSCGTLESLSYDIQVLRFERDTPAVWTSTDSKSQGAITVVVIGPTSDEDHDRQDVGQMYDIRLPDGSVTAAFDDELAPLPRAEQGKYIVGDWTHIFSDSPGDRAVRIVLDVENQKLLKLEIQSNRAILDCYRLATRLEFEDVEDSILNANSEVFSDPDSFGLLLTDELPAWATADSHGSA